MSGAKASIAMAVCTPMPGMVCNRFATSDACAAAFIAAVASEIFAVSFSM
jgi:hypothetical protein